MGTASRSDNPQSSTASQSAPEGSIPTQAIGTIRRFAEFCIAYEPEFIAGGIYPYEMADIRTNVAIIEGWSARFGVSLKEESSHTDHSSENGEM